MTKIRKLSEEQMQNKFEQSVLSNSTHRIQLDMMNYIIKIVERYYDLDPEYNIKKTRKREIVLGRQMAMYLIKKNTKAVLVEIGEMFNNKDHATVLHSCKTIDNLSETDKKIRVQVEELQKLVTFKSKVLKGDIKVGKDYYHVDLDNFQSLKLNNERTVILSGFSDEEMLQIERFLGQITEKRNHENTGMYIMEKRKQDE